MRIFSFTHVFKIIIGYSCHNTSNSNLLYAFFSAAGFDFHRQL